MIQVTMHRQEGCREAHCIGLFDGAFQHGMAPPGDPMERPAGWIGQPAMVEPDEPITAIGCGSQHQLMVLQSLDRDKQVMPVQGR